MKTFVVIGLGRFGTAAATKLRELGNEVLAIDTDEEAVNNIADYVTHAVVGDARDEKVLHSLGVKNYDCAVIAIGNDLAASALITLCLKEQGMKKVICKAGNDMEKKALEKIGADSVIIPERVMGQKLAKTLNSERFLDFIELSDEYGMVELTVPERWIGKSLKQLNIRSKHNVNVIAVKRDGDIIVSLIADFIFCAGDTLIVLGANSNLDKIRKL